MDWISVEERLPDSKDEVLFFTKMDYSSPLVCFGYKYNDDPEDIKWIDKAAFDSQCDFLECYYVTHWMPLPEPPHD